MLWSLLVVLGATNIAASFSGYRLPGNVKPLQYALEVDTELEPNFIFYGGVWIKIECMSPTRSIVLHSKELIISKEGIKLTEVRDNDDSSSDESEEAASLESLNVDEENEIITINFDKSLKKGMWYTLRVPFSGFLSEKPEGYYRGSYIDRQTGTTKWYAVTDFHYRQARRAFPCFDETDKKANFTLRLMHKDNLKAVSSMPLIKTIPNQSKSGYSYSYFYASPPMSTYLLGYMVSDFVTQELPTLPTNIKFGLWSRKEAVPLTQFIRDASPKLFSEFLFQLEFDYPLDKLDMAIVPKMSVSGLDRWGLINFKESDVLYNSNKPSLRRQVFIANLVSHELVDELIENVVTTKHWNKYWLYESLANYLGKISVDEVYYQWGFYDDSSLDLAMSVFDEDSALYAKPVSNTESTEIIKFFGHEAYNKGSYLLRMLHLTLGDPPILVGLRNFLRKYNYNNAEEEELWAEMTAVAHAIGTLDRSITVNDIMDGWTKQTGYPLLTVTRDYNTGSAKLTQKRRLRPKSDGVISVNTKWWVPITYTTHDHPNFSSTKTKLWMKPSQEVLELKNLDSKSWLLLNSKCAGLYRVKYDDQNWKMLTDFLNSDKYREMSAMDRAGLLMTAFDLAWSGEIPYSKAIPLINYLRREKEWLPWKVALKKIGDLRFILMRSALFKGSHIGGYFKDYVKQLLTPLYESDKDLTKISDNYYESELHYKMSAWTIRLEMGDVQDQALTLFVNWMKTENPDDYNPIPDGLREDIYCNSIWFEGNDRWDFLLQRYKFSQEGVDRKTIMEGLGCSQDKAILKKFLEWSITEGSVIRREDSFYVFGVLAKHAPSFPICFEFLQSRIKDIYAYHHGRSDIIGAYMKVYAENIHTKDELQKFQEFVRSNQEYLKNTVLATSVGTQAASANIKWYETNYDAFNEVLKEVTTRPGGVGGGTPTGSTKKKDESSRSDESD